MSTYRDPADTRAAEFAANLREFIEANAPALDIWLVEVHRRRCREPIRQLVGKPLGLTPSQSLLLSLILLHDIHGPLTAAAIAKHAGKKNTSTLRAELQRLVVLGLIEPTPVGYRAIRKIGYKLV